MTDLPLARYRSLDFWRGIACLSVVVFHSTFYAAAEPLTGFSGAAIRAATWLWAGVPMFFVISGFCIAAAADGQRRKGYSPRRYFLRRLRRIYPPYLIFLAIASAVVILGEFVAPGFFDDGSAHPIVHPARLKPLQWLGNATLTESWRRHLIGPSRLYAQGHAWTLCYEEQFYAVVGIALLLSAKRFGWICAGVTAVVLLLPRRMQLDGFFFDGRWLQFAIGLGVYWLANYAGRRSQIAASVGLLATAAYHIRLIDETFAQTHRDNSMVIAGAFGAVLLWLAPCDQTLHGARWARPVSWCGVMCYSVYLTHWPVCKAISHGMWLAGFRSPAVTLLLTVPACFVASVLVARVFYRTVERRFLN